MHVNVHIRGSYYELLIINIINITSLFFYEFTKNLGDINDI